MTEFGGEAVGAKRPDGTVRHAGQTLGMAPLNRQSDRARSLRMTADDSGQLPLDWAYAWRGLSRERYLEISEIIRRELAQSPHPYSEVIVRTLSVPGPPGPQGPAGPVGPPGPGPQADLAVGQTNTLAGRGVWVETDVSGNVKTFWVQTGDL